MASEKRSAVEKRRRRRMTKDQALSNRYPSFCKLRDTREPINVDKIVADADKQGNLALAVAIFCCIVLVVTIVVIKSIRSGPSIHPPSLQQAK